MTSKQMTSVFREESDSTLVAATKNGESQAFEFLVKRHEAKTFVVAFRITRNREDAQDVVQQSFHKAFMNLDRFQEKSSFSTWLTRIVINEGLMCLRRNRSRREISLDDVKSEFRGAVASGDSGSSERPCRDIRTTGERTHSLRSHQSVKCGISGRRLPATGGANGQ